MNARSEVNLYLYLLFTIRKGPYQIFIMRIPTNKSANCVFLQYMATCENIEIKQLRKTQILKAIEQYVYENVIRTSINMSIGNQYQ